jgi:hypothetical protein
MAAAAAIDGIQSRLKSVTRRGLPSKLDEVLDYLKLPLCTLGVALSILMEDQSLEASVLNRKIKRVLYEFEDLLDDLENHGSIRHRPNRRTWKVLSKLFPSSLSLIVTVSHTHILQNIAAWHPRL